MLNKSKGNMYNFVTHTWNPLAGQCPHKCIYCSTKKLKRYPVINKKYSGNLRLIESYLDDKFGENKTIFVCAQNDLFAESLEQDIILKIIGKCFENPYNKYLFQSKNPERMYSFYYPRDSILCTTIESDIEHNVSNAPSIYNRITWMKKIKEDRRLVKTMITIEPILKFDLKNLVELIKYANPNFINIGAKTGLKEIELNEPNKDEVEALKEALKGFNINIKKNISKII